MSIRAEPGGKRFFDFRFLNPFEKDISNDGTTLGMRYGAAQYILLISYVMAVLALVIIGRSPIAAVGYTFLWLSVYYNVSCLLIPEGSEKCFVNAWVNMILPWISFTIFTISAIFTASWIYNSIKSSVKKGGKKKKQEQEEQEEQDIPNNLDALITSFVGGAEKNLDDIIKAFSM